MLYCVDESYRSNHFDFVSLFIVFVSFFNYMIWHDIKALGDNFSKHKFSSVILIFAHSAMVETQPKVYLHLRAMIHRISQWFSLCSSLG